MDSVSTAPPCIVNGCERLSALTDVARGNLLDYHAQLCAECYQALYRGERLDIDMGRVELHYADAAERVRWALEDGEQPAGRVRPEAQDASK